MITTSSSLSKGVRDNFDAGPLSWVMGEIRAALSRSKMALYEAVAHDAESRLTALQHARTSLHQTHGALQIVDLDGVAIITETVEDLLERVGSGQLALTQHLVQAIEHAYQALVEYLEELLSGAPHQPVRLFPYYKALLEARGAERIHPADLFSVDLEIRPQLPPAEPSPPVEYVSLRQRFEKSLLPFLKNGETDLVHAAAMCGIIDEVERAQSNPQSRGFWWVLHGFAEAVSTGHIQDERDVKQLFALINLQIRRLSQGSSSIAERLLRDALFYIARAEHLPPRAQQIRNAYQVGGLVPADYETKRYGQIDVDALATAKERLAQAKNMWNRIARGDAGVEAFEQVMNGLAEVGNKLNSPPLAKLLHELNGIARHAVLAKPGDSLGAGMAASLLFVENALQNIAQLSDDFAERADALTARLLSVATGVQPVESAQWLDDIYRDAQQGQAMATLVGEMQAGLRQVEMMLDDYFREPSQRAGLVQIDQTLHQLEGALTILQQDDAMRAVLHTRGSVLRFMEVEPAAVAYLQPEFQHVAQNVAALSFFIEALQRDSGNAKKRFAFDEEQGLFRADVLEKSRATERPSDADELPVPEIEKDDAGQAVLVPETGPLSLSMIEDELTYHEQQSVELAISLTEEPHNPVLQMQLKEALEQVRRDATLVGNPDANDRAQAVIDILENPDFVASQDTLAGIITAAIPVVAYTPGEPIAAPAASITDETVDAELLAIFLSEAEEVLASIKRTVPESCNEPYNQEYLGALCRSFHTLKESGRMVGLLAFGEAAESIEQVLSHMLFEARSGSADLYALLDKAVEVLAAWVADFKMQGMSERNSYALVRAAERVKTGGAFFFEADLDVIPAAPWIAATAEMQVDASGLSGADISKRADLAASEQDNGAWSESPRVSIAEVIDFPGMRIPEVERDNIKHIGDLQISVPAHNRYLAETDELVRFLAQDIAEWRHEPERHVNPQAAHAAHSLADSSVTVGFKALQKIAHALEMVLQHLAHRPVSLAPHEYDTLELCIERLRFMLQKFALGELPADEPEYVLQLESMQQELEARAESDRSASSSAPELDAFEPSAPTDAVPFAEPVYASEESAAVDPATTLSDELNADLMPAFLEEGRDVLPHLGQALRSWQEGPADLATPQLLLRYLHTIKGSARMAGAMGLGRHFHEMETRIEKIMRSGLPSSQAIDDLLVRYDHGLQLFELLQNQDAIDANAKAASQEMTVLPSLTPSAANHFPVPGHASLNKVMPAALIRVRADILDRLVNQAGEVSISRSKLENEVGTLRQSLSDLTENVTRLRDQLREVEMQAETQITSRMAQSGEPELDPSEFDRLTRLQEITRMMAESVDDVGSIQKNLSRTVDNASTDLLAQGRLTRDLQQDLMRARMVQFASIAERLYRVTRQTAKEIDKRVNLEILGGEVEIDRSVLEKMTGSFEHLLRNAIVHGIEEREDRYAAGKNEIGELQIEIRQEGNEVAIRFSDDGQGLNLATIRDKARAAGLLTDESDMSDAEVRDLIFEPGFSTEVEITELSGRGIGMDVVRSEAAALGGRVSIFTEAGKGTYFTIHLPLTLAVTQVVLLSTGGTTYAVPSVLVEQVQQLKTNQLAVAYNDGAIVREGHRIPMHYLPALLGDAAAFPMAQHHSPLIVLKSGNDRIAIHVDQIHGNREVVVKNIGPQLSRMIGIAGATVLGSGEIVLILNPIPLALRLAHERARAPHSASSDALPAMGAVAEMAAHEPAAPKAEPVQGLRTQKMIMVVDDSLTVRRATQRLLSREGYQVVLAKDGMEALEHLQSVTPDVMLVDIEMPRMDGFDLTRNVRNDERTRHIPIIMVTSRTAAKHRNYAMELGVNEYLGKPYQETDLLRHISGFVKKEQAAARS